MTSWAEDWLGSLSGAGMAAFGCHFLRSTAGGGGGAIVGDGSFATVLWVAGGGEMR